MNYFICKTCIHQYNIKRKENHYIASKLPVNDLSSQLEKRVNHFLHNQDCQTDHATIRILSSNDRICVVKLQLKKYYPYQATNGYPYRTKAIFAFQEINGIDIVFCGMYVQEYDEYCPTPNTRRVYISYFDAVYFFQPKIYRTDVYHEILIGYLNYIKQHGYMYAHIWACPASEGIDYIFHRHPPEQRMLKSKRLQDWCKKMLDRAIAERIVINYKDIMQDCLDNQVQTVIDIPYFDGDFWPIIIENNINKLEQEEYEDLDNPFESEDSIEICGKRKSANTYENKKLKQTANQISNSTYLLSTIYSTMEKYKEVNYSKKQTFSSSPTTCEKCYNIEPKHEHKMISSVSSKVHVNQYDKHNSLNADDKSIASILICVTVDENLQISFPVRFGSRNYEKLWSFKLELGHVSGLAMNTTTEISLDPTDWNDLRLLGHKIMDNMIDYMRDIRLRPTWSPLPLTIKQTILNGDLPLQGQSPWQVYDEICTTILPYIIGNIHPLFWGHVYGSGSAIGALAEFITGTINTMSWGGQQASIYLERKVLCWLKLLMGFPNDETSSGILVSGTSVATIIALAVARKKFHERIMIIYCSKDTHSCIIRAANLLGINKENIVYVSTNEQRQIDVQALEAYIDPNACGFIVGSAGTVGTGAIDDLQGLADLCARRPNDLWFHVDGAIGAVACCSPRLRPLFTGLERADSIAFDLHKWLFIPYECGCILVRDGQLHRSTFAQPTVSYLTLMDGGITPSEGEYFFSDYGLELSRNTKAIKVWMTLKTYGIERFGRIMEQNVDQALYFAHLIEQHSNEVELLAKVTLNIVCFRYIGNEI
ncbi:unnamed protein product [Rotaria sordida]|uniref:histone acetyltransferase n=1 Tax=Rotaria sordida TaxID=392033 RepID=A0A814NJV8_9BILA|nr:unnamed protein product [Rotaria sordida]CAF1287801.1 unnamed protein product [Rotaria sordida]